MSEELLPPGNFFAVWRLAKILDKDRKTIVNLIDDGDIPVGIDVRRRASSRSSILVPRAAILEFLARRKIAAGNGHSPNGHHKNGRAVRT
jgi:Helix-turn-helix domain